MPAITDAYGRPLNNLRIAVTDECNYRCIFCHMEGESSEGPARPGAGRAILTPEDYWLVARAASLVGVSKFKVTGGEPLLRHDIVGIVENIHQASPQAEISMTTNGYFLAKLVGKLVNVGLKRVNVSIHSLRPEVYKFITGIPGLDRALKGLKVAVDAGLGVKVNMVVMRGLNEDEILTMAEFAAKHGATLQLIELHPVGLGAKFFRKYHYPLEKVEKTLEELASRVERRSLHNRPIYILPGGVRVEIVKPVSNPLFCAGCTRVRLGPYGDLLPCLNWRGPRPIITPILRNSSLTAEEKVVEIAEALVDLVASRKPFYMCTLKNCPTNGRVRLGRISHAKRAYYERLKMELRRQLVSTRARESIARGRAGK